MFRELLATQDFYMTILVVVMVLFFIIFLGIIFFTLRLKPDYTNYMKNFPIKNDNEI